MSGPNYRLIIGNKSWSSWSLRPWLVMKRFQLPFEEICIRLRQSNSRTQIFMHSPAGKVPALKVDDLVIWDSLAIIEHLADRYREHAIWPADIMARAVARSASGEMHAGFNALRKHCPMDILATLPKEEVPEPLELNIRRVISLWQDCRERFGAAGPFLFSQFSAADAMYAPVASRLRTYFTDLGRFGDDGTAAAYIETIFSMPEMAEWMAGAQAEEKSVADKVAASVSK